MKKAIFIAVALVVSFQVSAMACGVKGAGSHAEGEKAPAVETV